MSELPLYGPPRVGGDILSHCTRCKMELAHVVVSMLNGRPARVICKTCKSTHNYKRGTQTDLIRSTSRPSKPRKSPQKTYMKVSEMWEQKMAAAKNAQVKPYSVKQVFTAGDVINHPNFGVGLVEEVKSNGKITVLFRNDEKVLVHGMGQTVGA